MIYLFTLAPKLTAGLLIGIPVVVLAHRGHIGRRLEKASRSSQDRVADIGTITSESLGALKIVQAFGQENREHIRFSRTPSRATFAAAKRRIRPCALH